MIRAVIFDMDGLLIDSEPFWKEAEMQVFPSLGIPLNDGMWKETIGIRIDEVIDHYYHKFPWDLQRFPKLEVKNRIEDHLIRLIFREGAAMNGVGGTLEFFRRKAIPLALASSSDMRIINAVLKKLQLAHYFQVIYSAETEKYGKPHPAVYLATAEKLGIPPPRCLAFEDSINGLISAKAARMKCVAVPNAALRGDKRLGIADLVLDSLAEFTEAKWRELNEEWPPA